MIWPRSQSQLVMELTLTCLLASSMALSNCLARDPHSRVFSSSRSWDWWIASSLLAITCRNSIFWALVASSFLGESTQSDPVHAHTCPVPPCQGAAATLDQGSHHAGNLQGATGINQRNLLISQVARNCSWSSWLESWVKSRERKQTDRGCAKYAHLHVIQQRAAREGGFPYSPPFR